MKNKKLFAILTLLCFLFTLMPVAAFAADTDLSSSASVVQTVDADASAGIGEDVEIVFALNDRAGETVTTTVQVYVWATTTENGTVPVDALAGSDADGVLAIGAVKNGVKVTDKVSFLRAGTYYLHAAFEKPTFKNGSIAAAKELTRTEGKNSVAVSGSSRDPYVYYKAGVVGTATATNPVGYLEELALPFTLVPNNVANTVTVNFFNNVDGVDANGDKVVAGVNKVMAAGKAVQISTNSANVTVSKEIAYTDILGQITFDVSASREGNYYIYLTVDGVEFRIKVSNSNTSAAYIETVSQPAAPKALYGTLPTVRFQVTDINGNIVAGKDGQEPTDSGMVGIEKNNDANATYKGKYVVLTSKPAASKLTSKDFYLTYDKNHSAYKLANGGKVMDAEGIYEFKVILDNGAYATASFEIKAFQTPVKLRIDYYTTTVELGGVIAPSQIVYVDANGVEKQATDADFAATGYAIYDLTDRKITVKTDEKYVGSKINVTAVSDRYNLVAAVELTVAEGASEIAFASKTADVNVNNKIKWNIVDSQGNKVGLTNDANATNVTLGEIKYIVLDKPVDAKVSVYDATITSDLIQKGEGKMALTSSKVGNVTVQAIVKAEYKVTSVGQDAEKTQTKYYTGTQIFAVGTEGVGDVVVMSVGSNEIIINDAKATIDAAPIIENNRTFVPFRALAEAFGATVAYDEATQAVTAELNGVTVVMTIGSATYTVNGVEKTADVAPFINGSRTMVPVRFAAEAFGIKVIPTYDENGATADILFNL